MNTLLKTKPSLVRVQRHPIPGSDLVAVSRSQLDELEQTAEYAANGSDVAVEDMASVRALVTAMGEALQANDAQAVLAAFTHLEELVGLGRGQRLIDRLTGWGRA